MRGSPSKWKQADGEAVVQAVREAALKPVVREVDQIKLGRRPTPVRAKIGAVTVPDSDASAEENTSTKAPKLTRNGAMALRMR